MDDERSKGVPAHSGRLVMVGGKLPKLSAKNLSRIAVYLVRGNQVLSESPVNAVGAFQLHVVPHLRDEAGVRLVLGPKGMDAQSLAARSDLPAVDLSSGRGSAHAITIDFGKFEINDEFIDPWWIWCREYTVSGTLQTAAGCPIGAQVTVYNVTSTTSGLVETPLATVSTDANGNFTATFNWCTSRFCWWPCWPFWWYCWPWWWELDILAVLENLERQIQVGPLQSIAGPPRPISAKVAPLRQPNSADLMTGIGFAALHRGGDLQPDSQRTALIASKFANPGIREIFPWWWWCCENPNIVFSATQGTTTILDEDPNTSTRWCFDSGQTVSLTGNSESLGACQVQTGGECAFAWTSVGSEPPFAVLADDIWMGYAPGSGACSDLAFGGSLNLNGNFGGDCVAFYQVLAGQWTDSPLANILTARNPARGGTKPLAFGALSPTLVNYVTIWRDATKTPEQDAVVLGPCSFNGHDNLYVTLSQRQSGGLDPSVLAQIGNFPALGPGDFVIGWAYTDLVLTVPATSLVSPNPTGGVDLEIAAYDATGNPIPSADIDMGPNLTLMIDTTPLTTTTIDWPTMAPFLSGVYNSDGTPASLTVEGEGCPAYQLTTPTGYVLIHTTVVDDAGHLCEYRIVTEYGNGSTLSATPSDRDYAQPVSSFTPPGSQGYGVDSGYNPPNDSPPFPAPPLPAPAPAATNWTYVGGGDTIRVDISQSCCYDFQLRVSKRITDGETGACGEYIAAFQTVNIVVG